MYIAIVGAAGLKFLLIMISLVQDGNVKSLLEHVVTMVTILFRKLMILRKLKKDMDLDFNHQPLRIIYEIRYQETIQS